MPTKKDEQLKGWSLHTDDLHSPKGRAQDILKQKGEVGWSPDTLYTPTHQGNSFECVLWLYGVEGGWCGHKDLFEQ